MRGDGRNLPLDHFRAARNAPRVSAGHKQDIGADGEFSVHASQRAHQLQFHRARNRSRLIGV